MSKILDGLFWLALHLFSATRKAPKLDELANWEKQHEKD